MNVPLYLLGNSRPPQKFWNKRVKEVQSVWADRHASLSLSAFSTEIGD